MVKLASKPPCHKWEMNEGITTNDDGKARISWRQDGQYFACSFISDSHREIFVFDREGNLISAKSLQKAWGQHWLGERMTR